MIFDIVGKRFRLFLISGVVILIGIISLATFGQLKFGIEFSSGSMMTVRFEQKVDHSELRQELVSLGYTNAIVAYCSNGSRNMCTVPMPIRWIVILFHKIPSANVVNITVTVIIC